MAHPNDNIEGVAALGFLIGIYTFFKGFREFRKYRLIADTPEIPIRSVPMGFVEIHGKAEGDETVRSPVSHTTCFGYRVVIERWESGSRSAGWKHLRTDSDGVNFYLSDSTGKVLVNARGAELDLPRTAQRAARSGATPTPGPGATNEELLKYVAEAGVHWFTDLAERGLESVGPLSDQTKEEKRQMLMGLLKNAPGSPEFQRQMMAMMAPKLKERLEKQGPQSDPSKEQARQAMLAAFEHPPGSPEFLEALGRAEALAGKPDLAGKFAREMQAGGPVAFNPASGHYRFTEYCLVPGAPYDVSGTCTENPSPRDEHDRNMIVRGRNESTFLISSKPEKVLEASLRKRALGKIFGGAALSIVCLAILLAKHGLLRVTF